MMTFLEQFRAARRVSTPLMAVRTPDPAATIANILANANGCPMLGWDIVRGPIGINPEGAAVTKQMCAGDPPELLANPVETLTRAAKFMPQKAILFFYNADQFIKEPTVIQAIWNLRDVFKTNYRTLVLLCPDITLPTALSQDVMILDEPLPDAKQIESIVLETYETVSLPKPNADDLAKSVAAVSGLAAFPTETACAMSITKTGMDYENLWERKRKTIEQTKGLSIGRGNDTFKSVAGLSNVKRWFTQRGKGPDPRRGIVFIDEIDKHMAGFGAVGTGDTTTEMAGALLTFMEDIEAEGCLFLGVPGVGKTMLGRAIAKEWGVPLINYDMSGMKGSLVGESGAAIRNANKIVSAVTGDKPFFIATCNKIGNLPPELRRRFRSCTFFFDLSTKEERDAAWDLYEAKYAVNLDRFAGPNKQIAKKGPRPKDDNWTPAEIRNCCYNAYVTGVSLVESASYIVPVYESAKEQIETLRREADSRFISASYSGLFKLAQPELAPVARRRSLQARDSDVAP